MERIPGATERPTQSSRNWRSYWKLAILALVAIPIIWAAYLGITLLRTEAQIHQSLPKQANGAISPVARGTQPTIIFLTPSPHPAHMSTRPRRGVASTATPTPTARIVPTQSPPTAPTVASTPTETAPKKPVTKSLPSSSPTPRPTKAPTATPLPSATPVPMTSWHGKSRINVLLLGTDQRSPGEDPRSDTIILASLDFQHDKAYVLSVPRDLYVIIPGFKYWKINAAYALGEDPKYSKQVGGGVGLMMTTLRYNFGIDSIDAFGVINFEGFRQAVDALGGIDIDVDHKLVDTCYPVGFGCKTVVFNPGMQHMDGERALEYARTRHPDNDFGRMARQQQVMLAIQQKARNPKILLEAPLLLHAMGANVKTNLSLGDQLELARWAESLPKSNIEFHEITGPIGMTQDGQSVVWPEWDKSNPILERVFGPSAGHR